MTSAGLIDTVDEEVSTLTIHDTDLPSPTSHSAVDGHAAKIEEEMKSPPADEETPALAITITPAATVTSPAAIPVIHQRSQSSVPINAHSHAHGPRHAASVSIPHSHGHGHSTKSEAKSLLMLTSLTQQLIAPLTSHSSSAYHTQLLLVTNDLRKQLKHTNTINGSIVNCNDIFTFTGADDSVNTYGVRSDGTSAGHNESISINPSASVSRAAGHGQQPSISVSYSALSPDSPRHHHHLESIGSLAALAQLTLSQSASPIVDIGVVIGKNASKVPKGWTYIARTLAGTNAVLGGKRVFVCYKRAEDEPATSTLAPITSIAVVFKDLYEEAPYGFDLIDRTLDGKSANLNPIYRQSNAAIQNSRHVFLAVHRGEGPPINQLAMIQIPKRRSSSNNSGAVLPSGYHQVKQTPFAHSAELQSGNTSTSDSGFFLCFRPNVQTIILALYEPLMTQEVSYYQSMTIQLSALVTAAVYSGEVDLALAAVSVAKHLCRLSVSQLSSPLLNTLIASVCDATPVFLSYFHSEAHAAVLSLLLDVYQSARTTDLSLTTAMKMIETCFLTRHEDKHYEISSKLIGQLMAKIKAQRQCQCQTFASKGRTVQSRSHESNTDKLTGGDSEEKQQSQSQRPLSFNGESTLSQSQSLCYFCRWRASMARWPVTSMCRALISRTASHIDLVKQLVVLRKSFPRHRSTGAEFRRSIEFIVIVLQWADYDDRLKLDEVLSADTATLSDSEATIEKHLYAIILYNCKIITENANFSLKKSEMVKRKVHGLTLLLQALQASQGAFAYTRGSVLLLRRFVCPSLLTACVTDVPIVFRLILQIFKFLFDHYHRHLVIEIATMIDHLFLPVLESPLCTVQQKKDILDVLQHCVGTPASTVSLFYNYDNHVPARKIFQKLVTVVSKLCEGGSQSAFGSSASFSEKDISADATAAIATDSEEAHELIRRTSIKLLVHILHMMAVWLGVPNVSRPSNLTRTSAHAQLLAQRDANNDRVLASPSSTNTSQPIKSIHITPPTPSDETRSLTVTNTDANSSSLAPSRDAMQIENALAIHEKLIANLVKNSTWLGRFDKQKAEAQIVDHALKLARTDSLKKALAYLKMVFPPSSAISEMAKFMYKNDGLDRREIGDILSNLEDSLLTEPEYSELRTCYLSLLDFSSMSFDSALRSYLTESGFRLPGEAQKIDRLLSAFCTSYCKDNPGVFPSADAAFVLAFAVVMLNTDLHNHAMKSRPQMTEDQFISNLRGVNDKGDFPRQMLLEIYHSVRENEIAWKADSDSSADKSSSMSAEDRKRAQQKKEARDIALRQFLEKLARQGGAELKNTAAEQRNLYATDDNRIVQGMFEVSWLKCIAAIAVTCETSADVDILHSCLDGLAHGTCIAISLGLIMERQAYTRVLARLTFIEKAMGTFSFHSLISAQWSEQAADIQRRIIHLEHLKQDWYRPLNLEAERDPIKACGNIQRQCQQTKHKVSLEQRASIVKKLQQAFGGDIVLANGHRSLLKQGTLYKLSSASDNKKGTLYHFFLLSDVLVYASAGSMGQQYKFHRALHLSLCRLEDIRNDSFGSHAFRIVSPQKSIIVQAASDDSKKHWIEAIVTQCQLQCKKRKAYIQQELAKLQSNQHTSGQDKQQQATGQNGAVATTAAPSPITVKLGRPGHKVTKSESVLPHFSNLINDPTLSTSSDRDASSNDSGISSPLPTHHSYGTEESQAEPQPRQSEILRRYSTFIGSTFSDVPELKSPSATGHRISGSGSSHSSKVASVKSMREKSKTLNPKQFNENHSGATSNSGGEAVKDHCKLCLRIFTLFRRRQTCPWCADSVCNECCSQTIQLPEALAVTTKRASLDSSDGKPSLAAIDETAATAASASTKDKGKVCDACAGILAGAVDENHSLLILSQS